MKRIDFMCIRFDLRCILWLSDDDYTDVRSCIEVQHIESHEVESIELQCAQLNNIENLALKGLAFDYLFYGKNSDYISDKRTEITKEEIQSLHRAVFGDLDDQSREVEQAKKYINKVTNRNITVALLILAAGFAILALIITVNPLFALAYIPWVIGIFSPPFQKMSQSTQGHDFHRMMILKYRSQMEPLANRPRFLASWSVMKASHVAINSAGGEGLTEIENSIINLIPTIHQMNGWTAPTTRELDWISRYVALQSKDEKLTTTVSRAAAWNNAITTDNLLTELLLPQSKVFQSPPNQSLIEPEHVGLVPTDNSECLRR